MKNMTAEVKVGIMTVVGVILLLFEVVGLSHSDLLR